MLLGVLALATSAGAFGGPAAAAGLPPDLIVQAEDLVAPVRPRRSAAAAGFPRRRRRDAGAGRAGVAYSFGASTQRSMSRS